MEKFEPGHVCLACAGLSSLNGFGGHFGGCGVDGQLELSVLRGLWRRLRAASKCAACQRHEQPAINAQTAVLGLFVWELVKIALTVAMLFGATRVLKDLSWPALLVGLVLTMKVNWVVLAWQQVRQSKAKVRTD